MINSSFYFPAEWEKHEATWLTWPQNTATWETKLETVRKIWVEMISHLSQHETVHLLVNDKATADDVTKRLEQANVSSTSAPSHERTIAPVILHLFPTNDCWMRDCGPIFVKNKEGKIGLTDWEFNMWGGKYPPWDDDNRVPSRVYDYYKARNFSYFKTNIVMEGGSLDGNGAGTLLTTESCLLNKNRNPHLSKTEIENILKKYLGVTNIIWLGEGIVGDDTDGHVDDITRFVNKNTIITMVEENKNDPNFIHLDHNLKLLEKTKDQDGNPLNIVPIQMPIPVTDQGLRLPASYANFYIGNGVVLVPIFDCKYDDKALETLQKLFPNRKVIGIRCNDVVWGLGAIHCVTQQQPA